MFCVSLENCPDFRSFRSETKNSTSMLKSIYFLACMDRVIQKQESFLKVCPILIILKNSFEMTSKAGCIGCAMTSASRTFVLIFPRGTVLFSDSIYASIDHVLLIYYATSFSAAILYTLAIVYHRKFLFPLLSFDAI